MRWLRSAVLVSVVSGALGVSVALGAAGAAPSGRLTARARATHVLLGPVVLGGAELAAGIGVEALGLRAGGQGRVAIRTTGHVELNGKVAGKLLGLRVARDVELTEPGTGRSLGTARAGALVRELGGRARTGSARVETHGAVVVIAELPSDALTAQPVELLATGGWQYVAGEATELRAGPDASQPLVARLAPGARVELIEQQGASARVRTHGGHDCSGWLAAAALRPRRPSDTPGRPPQLVKPTHEVELSIALVAPGPRGRKVATLHGGALVERIEVAAGRARVLTAGPVTVEGWVPVTELAQLGKGFGDLPLGP